MFISCILGFFQQKQTKTCSFHINSNNQLSPSILPYSTLFRRSYLHRLRCDWKLFRYRCVWNSYIYCWKNQRLHIICAMYLWHKLRVIKMMLYIKLDRMNAKLLLLLASTVILGSESHRTRDGILLPGGHGSLQTEWLTFLRHMRQIPGFNIGPETGCSDWGVPKVSYTSG
jgi:hypothetical protein